jgi:hypothetical protein
MALLFHVMLKNDLLYKQMIKLGTLDRRFTFNITVMYYLL